MTKYKEHEINKNLLFITSLLVIFGLAMIASAGIAYSRSRFGDSYYFFKHQLFYGVLPGLFILYVTQKINYNFWRKIAFPFFILSIFLLILVFVPGVGSKVYGASRWLQLGPFSFQPSEMLKLAIIIYLSAWLESRAEKVKDFYEGLLPFLAVVGVVSFLLEKQPDMGTLGVIIFIAMSIFFISGARLSHMFMIAGSGFAALALLIKFESYRMDRFLVFLHPELDPRGIGYQINQALLAIGSGGIFGVGLGHSMQKFNYLPEPVGDSIFAIIGEELGLIGVLILVFLFLALAMIGFRIAKNAPDRFSQLTAVGITCWITFQALINISAISGIIPLTGIPLPFISYGGTSLIFLMAGIGVLLNISKQTSSNN
ncbi:MAG: putative lipid II flippase FtsW [Candidatus Moraniibacteriota bacterium]